MLLGRGAFVLGEERGVVDENRGRLYCEGPVCSEKSLFLSD